MKHFDFRLYDTPELPPSASEFLNRNRFYISGQRAVTAEELNEIQRQRGMLFAVLAFEDEACVGMVAAYPVAGQKVAKAHQLFIGTLIIDRTRLVMPKTIMTIFRLSLEETHRRGYREIRSEVSSANLLSYALMCRHGFVLLENRPDHYGYYELRNYMPAIYTFFGRDNLASVGHTEYFDYHFLPRTKKSERYRVCTYHDEHTIKQDFSLFKDRLTLYLDIEKSCVTGFAFQHGIQIVPNGSSYDISTMSDTHDSVRLDSNGVIAEETVRKGEHKRITMPDNQKVVVSCYQRCFVLNGEFDTGQCISEQQLVYEGTDYKAYVDKATGMLTFFDPSGEDELLRIPMALCDSHYIEGAMQSPPKKLDISIAPDQIVMHAHPGGRYPTVVCKCSDARIDLRFRRMDDAPTDRALYVQLWTKGVCASHPANPDFADYPFWCANEDSLSSDVEIQTESARFHVCSNRMIVNLPSVMIVERNNVQIDVAIRFG